MCVIIYSKANEIKQKKITAHFYIIATDRMISQSRRRKRRSENIAYEKKIGKIFRTIDLSHAATNVMSEQQEVIHLNAKKGT